MKNSHLSYFRGNAISSCCGDYMDYYNSTKELTKKAKDYSKNKSEVYTYYNVGKLLKEAGKCYGATNLKRMIKFIISFKKVRSLRAFFGFVNIFI